MREEILRILLDHKEEFISGERISSQLGVTRAAVWKYISSLREEGYPIESISKKGYRLLGAPDTLETAILQHGLHTETMGRSMEVYPVIDSTNKKAKERALEGAPEGTLILAEEQTHGRGRLDRMWVSPAGTGVWMSLILRPPLAPVDAPKITAMAAVAITKAIQEAAGLQPGIKWPNDIILDGKKVCGILTEIQADPDQIHYIVVGMGMNVNMKQEDFPESIRAAATSLRIQAGREICRSRIVQAVMRSLEQVYQEYMDSGSFTNILEFCSAHSLTLGRQVKVIGRDEEYEALAAALGEDGSLLVEMQDGSIRRVRSGDVSVRGINGYV